MKSAGDTRPIFSKALGEDRIITDKESLAKYNANSLGLAPSLCAVLIPHDAAEVQAVVRIANEHSIPLKPISRGQNIGYGRMQACVKQAVLLDLSHMDNISDYDEENGTIRVQPGVTQGQLYSFLQERGSRHFPDATGSRKDSSILGNSVEGGFGHTPMGNRRALLSDVELVLADGEIVRTGVFPDQGPDLSALCVQYNMGIIVSAQVRLNLTPERYESFLVVVDEESRLEALFDAIAELRRQGTLTSLVHIANATRFVMSVGNVPPGWEDKLLSSDEAARLLGGYWFAIGGLYGPAREVAAKAATVKERIGGIGKLIFFHDSYWNPRGPFGLGMQGMEQNARAMMASRARQMVLGLIPPLAKTAKRLIPMALSYRPIHEMMRGVPSDMAYEKMRQWRVSKPENMGIGWIAPTGPSSGRYARKVIDTLAPVYKAHGFELPMTITLVEPGRFVCVSNINFDLSNPEAVENAHAFERDVHKALREAGIREYRNSVLGMPGIQYEGNRKHLLELIKRAVDPKLIIDPGRYNIGWPDSSGAD